MVCSVKAGLRGDVCVIRTKKIHIFSVGTDGIYGTVVASKYGFGREFKYYDGK